MNWTVSTSVMNLTFNFESYQYLFFRKDNTTCSSFPRSSSWQTQIGINSQRFKYVWLYTAIKCQLSWRNKKYFFVSAFSATFWPSAQKVACDIFKISALSYSLFLITNQYYGRFQSRQRAHRRTKIGNS